MGIRKGSEGPWVQGTLEDKKHATDFRGEK
jgi:hypothetical protein